MNPIANPVSWIYQKHKHLIDSLLLRQAPRFVYARNPAELEGEIPVFTFHVALPEWFEEQCLHLARNGYEALSAEKFVDLMHRTGHTPRKSVLITFDDGLKQLWTVAFPLLKRYGLRATCFLIPGCIPADSSLVRPTLEDVWQGRASVEEVLAFRRGEPALATWEEIRIMHDSGVIDFHSHTMYHSLVFTSPDVFDFIHPGYNTHFYGNIHVPLYTHDGRDVTSREPLLGMPIYRSAPRMQATARFFDDEQVRMQCVEEVRREGGPDFFKNGNWRKRLGNVVRRSRGAPGVSERYETNEERDHAIREELVASRQAIEQKLPGAKVTHLCYPWYEAKPFAIEASRKAGFEVNYFGHRASRPTNRPGQDLYGVVRVEDMFLERLPGTGRVTLAQIAQRLRSLRSLPGRLFPDAHRTAA